MRFSHANLATSLEWDEDNHLNELIVESPSFMRSVLYDLSNLGDTAKSRFTDNGKPLGLNKEVDVIYNPLNLDFNNRRAIATLLKLLVRSSLSEDMYMETNELKSRVIKYLDNLVDSENFIFNVETDDFAIDAIAKAVNLHIVDDEDNFIDLLTDYMSMMSELVGIKLFVFLNLRSVIDDGEVARLIGNINNHQLDVFMIENQYRGKIGDCGQIIVDKDLCEI